SWKRPKHSDCSICSMSCLSSKTKANPLFLEFFSSLLNFIFSLSNMFGRHTQSLLDVFDFYLTGFRNANRLTPDFLSKFLEKLPPIHISQGNLTGAGRRINHLKENSFG